MLISCALKFIAVLQKLIKKVLRSKTYFLGSKSVIFKTVNKQKLSKKAFQLQHNILKLKNIYNHKLNAAKICQWTNFYIFFPVSMSPSTEGFINQFCDQKVW